MFVFGCSSVAVDCVLCYYLCAFKLIVLLLDLWAVGVCFLGCGLGVLGVRLIVLYMLFLVIVFILICCGFGVRCLVCFLLLLLLVY